ncbi:Dam family site-specific DNA-(adenine-N6)-methyltransferase [Glaciecola petra]|uniref:site-specific DNA-methyltransferase (adenine-specific) n=1 Tax=Glaciecola petra TaxID=3075602 RepID=A0ABU2ZVV6_9ALTE|nr:Dam family site-specific DNA-(adenine-N6)-methyltransferase [Aestuariibacter sp. P117]MDT0595552.1 Dam family site-specific DNA-(adenine-N6)-methyltransferase [Aestuariibacter sp. P117]
MSNNETTLAGYNGLCRYNKSGGYNVPFGRYKRPYFPLDEIRTFAQRAKYASFHQGDFSFAFEKLNKGDVIYCDPPYSPINKTASFTAYSGTNFDVDDHKRLVDLAERAKHSGVTTIISNHCLPDTLSLYIKADKIVKFDVARTISCNGKIRKSCKELMAVYTP